MTQDLEAQVKAAIAKIMGSKEHEQSPMPVKAIRIGKKADAKKKAARKRAKAARRMSRRKK